jgi:hypothetical protein
MEIVGEDEIGTFIGDGPSTGTVLALGIPLAALSTYGIYRATRPSEGSGSSSSAPWLYKMNPSYWFKSDAEKKYISIEKSRGKRNVELDKEVEAAKRAYYTSSAASEKEQQIAAMDAQMKSQGVLK